MNDEGESEAGSTLETCRATFAGGHYDKQLADKIENSHPELACEAFAVSPVSPGPVKDDEKLWRVMVSPRDIDETGFVHEAPFHKVRDNGLSVVRSIASRSELMALASDGLGKAKNEHVPTVRGVLQAPVGGVDGIRARIDDQGSRLFGVYDQTVPRSDIDPSHVPTHAGIFLRVPKPGTPDRKNVQKDYAGELRELFLKGPLDWEALLGGALVETNEIARQQHSSKLSAGDIKPA